MLIKGDWNKSHEEDSLTRRKTNTQLTIFFLILCKKKVKINLFNSVGSWLLVFCSQLPASTGRLAKHGVSYLAKANQHAQPVVQIM